jgi:hypothetical protein
MRAQSLVVKWLQSGRWRLLMIKPIPAFCGDPRSRHGACRRVPYAASGSLVRASEGSAKPSVSAGTASTLCGAGLEGRAFETLGFFGGTDALVAGATAAGVTGALGAAVFFPGPRVLFSGALTEVSATASAAALGFRGARVFFSLVFEDASTDAVSTEGVGFMSSAIG